MRHEARGAEVLRVHELTGLPLEMLLRGHRRRAFARRERTLRTTSAGLDRQGVLGWCGRNVPTRLCTAGTARGCPRFTPQNTTPNKAGYHGLPDQWHNRRTGRGLTRLQFR